MRRLIIYILLFGCFTSFAQDLSFKQVDSTTYSHYNNKNWEELTRFGKNVEFNYYYYFNVRMGVAFFYQKKYHSAEKYLLLAIDNNKTDFANLYLFWTYFNLGETFLTEQTYNQLSKETKNNLKYKNSFIESVYFEGGIKNPSINEINNTIFKSVSLNHRIGSKIKINHTLDLYSQNNDNLLYNSKQYIFYGAYLFSTSSVGFGFLLSNTTINENRIDSAYTQNVLDLSNILSTIELPANSFYINYYKRFTRLKLIANINYISQKSTLTTITTFNRPQDTHPSTNASISNTETISSNSSVLIPSINAIYTPKILADKVSVGIETFLTLSDDIKYFTIKPQLNVSISDKFWVNIYYIDVKDYLFSDYSSGILYNVPNLAIKRFSGTLSHAFLPNFILKLSYTRENFDFNELELRYNVNSIFLGLQLKF